MLLSLIQEVKLNNRDYSTFSRDAAMTDFRKRIECYEAAHEPLDDNFDRSARYVICLHTQHYWLVIDLVKVCQYA